MMENFDLMLEIEKFISHSSLTSDDTIGELLEALLEETE